MAITFESAPVRAEQRPSFKWSVKVRYGECDAQGVVFNANYLAYVDAFVDEWFTSALGDEYQERFDAMVKAATVEWHAPARRRELLEVTGWVSRWGNSSFDVAVTGSVSGRDIFDARVTYISVEPGAHVPTPVPGWVRAALGQISRNRTP